MARSRTIDEFTKPTGTIIGKGVSIRAAHFTCSDCESIRIDGTVGGDIDVDGVLIISESGHVDGNVNANFVRVAGRVTGNVNCRNALHLAATADVMGDVRTASLIIDDGAILLGRCQTNVALESEAARLTQA